MTDWRKQIDFRGLLQARAGAVRRPRLRTTPKIPREEPKGREVVGLEIGASHLAAARVVNNGTKEILQLVREPLAPGIVAGGEVRDPLGLGSALEAFFAQHQLPRRGVRLGLGNTRVGVRVIEIAGIEDEAQLENAISFRAAEMLSVPIDDAALDYHVIGEGVGDDGQPTQRIVLVVAYRDSIARFLAAADHAGIQIAGIDLEAFALLRAVLEPGAEHTAEAAVVAICVGHERTTLAISDGNACEFARVLEWGGSSLTAALARALKISGQEAEELKHSLSLEPDAPAPEEITAARNEEALEAIRHELQKLVRELLSSLRFYQSQQGSLPIGDVLICGGTANATGLAGELERELGMQVRVADPFTRVLLGEGLERPEATGSFAVAIGLGIEDQ
jgi:type IV pilus assembly protein PilM